MMLIEEEIFKMYEDSNKENQIDERGVPSGADDTYRPEGDAPAENRPSGKRFSGWKKGLAIFLMVVVLLIVFGLLVGRGGSPAQKATDRAMKLQIDTSGSYIGVLSIDGTMTSTNDPGDTYNQGWLLSQLEQMRDDPDNQGIILRVNTPGGAAYTADELYLAIMAYKSQTGRPVYTYMDSQATSGGYYVAAGTDKIYANRNCWTGSIGVTVGTFFDFSGFLEKMGVKTVTITSGKNKAMGGSTEPMTKEQRELIQGLVDEAYDQFIDIVCEGRKMPKEKVKKLADGRIYTAKQAKENGLIDEVGTLDEAIQNMMTVYGFSDCDVEYLAYEPKSPSIFDLLYGLAKNNRSSAESEMEELKGLAEEGSTITLTYLAEIRK